MIRSRRTFSKRMIVVNCFLAWGSIYFAIWQNQSEWIAVTGFGFLTTIISYYMHVGAKDLTTILKSNIESQKIEKAPVPDGPAMPPPGENE